jgi:aryl-alcohol dehydrogenase-like predicted oxidoreductase
MARHLDLAVTPFSIIGGGSLTGKYDDKDGGPRRYEEIDDHRRELAGKIREFARLHDRSPAQVAINWVRQQQDRALIIPILGARTEAQIKDNLGVLEFELTADQLLELENLSAFDPGFPRTFLEDDAVKKLIHGETYELIDNHRG